MLWVYCCDVNKCWLIAKLFRRGLKWVSTRVNGVTRSDNIANGVPRPQRALCAWQCTFLGGKIAFPHGNAKSRAAIFQPCPSYPVAFSCRTKISLLSLLLLAGMSRILLLPLKFSNIYWSMKFFNITVWLEIQGDRCKIERGPHFLQEPPKDFYHSYYLDLK